MVASPSTLLRYIRRTAIIPSPPPGVDGFSMRRGHNYGTMIVDLEQRRPLDLVAESEKALLSALGLSHYRFFRRMVYRRHLHGRKRR
jgi:hypothetical protein